MQDSSRLPVGSSARQERAERILDTAAELLGQHGYKRVTVDDVAGHAGVGKGTIYLHWKTREALFWAVLQRAAMRMLEQLAADLSRDADLALPGRLMPAIFLEAAHRPLVRALLLSDAEVLGNLAKDETVAAAQRELAGNKDYLALLAEQGLLRPGLSPETAGHILGSVMRGFFSAEDHGEHSGLPLEEQAALLAEVIRRSLEIDGLAPAEAVAALSTQVIELFTAIVNVQRDQLQRAYL
jgi:AcrR family transcriptional regulator